MQADSRKTVAVAALWLALAGSAAAAAEHTTQSHSSIREAAERHALDTAQSLPGTPQVKVGSLDSRLKLSACDQPLEAYESPNGLTGGRGVVGVRCNGSKPWKIYVPVHVALLEQVVINRRPLVRGQTITAGDVLLDEVDTSGLHQAFFTRISDVVGLRSKRAVNAGSTLHAGMLERARLVRRGSQVQILALADGLQVRMRGKALADGGRGDRIRVKNLNSGRVITGTVAAAGVIEVLN
jgi:flagella basal body P-ring formation protein FlgA